MISKLFRSFGICVIALVMFSSSVPAKPADGAVHPEMIVSAKWLSEHLNDPKVIVLHVAQKREEYDKGHIPGARFLALEDFIEGNEAELHCQHAFRKTRDFRVNLLRRERLELGQVHPVDQGAMQTRLHLLERVLAGAVGDRAGNVRVAD